MRDTETAAASMKPGTYLEKRRRAAGLDLDDVARILAGPAGAARAAALRGDLVELESGTSDFPAARASELVQALRGVFRFDIDVYNALVVRAADPDTELPYPPICRVCACTWNDACTDRRRGPCSWAEPDLCSHCVGRGPANDGEASHAA